MSEKKRVVTPGAGRADREQAIRDLIAECRRLASESRQAHGEAFRQEEFVVAMAALANADVREEIADELEALLASPVAEAWQDISTAPKDREILLYEDRRIVSGSWNHGGVFFMPHWMGGLFHPTHWMERPDLPVPPIPKGETAP